MTLLASCGQNIDCSKKTQNLNISFNSDPGSLDPRRGGDVSKTIIEFMLFEGLTRFSKEGIIEFAGAEAIHISLDQKTYTFILKDNVWSDGTPVEAIHYERAWKDILSPSFPASFAHLLYSIQNAEQAKRGEVSLDSVGVKAIDSKTLVVTLEHPTPYFLELTAFFTFFPIKFGKNETDFLYNGPFILTDWQPNFQISVEKNPRYWASSEVHLDRITVHIIDHEMTNLHMYEKGELDIVGVPLAPLPVDSLPILYKEGKLHTQSVAGSTLCVFNTQEAPFSNVHIRKAFALAIDRQKIVDSITQIGEEIATAVLPPLLKNDKQALLFKDHDQENARRHLKLGLKELDLEALPLITYIYLKGEVNTKMAELLQEEWRSVLGANVQIEKMESKNLLFHLDNKKYQIGQASWLAFYTDPINILERFKLKENSKNYSGWEHPSYKHLITRSFEESMEERMMTFEKAEQLLIEEMPISVIHHWKYGYLKNAKLEGIFISPIGDIYFTHAYFK